MENLKKVKTQVSLDDDEVPEPMSAKGDEAGTLEMEECLQACLPKLSPDNRKLILAYYAKEKQAKIDNRSELARQLPVETLRVKVYRIRVSLQECIERCLERKANQR